MKNKKKIKNLRVKLKYWNKKLKKKRVNIKQRVRNEKKSIKIQLKL